MTLRRSASVILALLVGAQAARAQSSLPEVLGAPQPGLTVPAPGALSPSSPMSGPIDPAEYVLGPGDILQVVVSGGVTRSWNAMVLPEGTLVLPSVGSIPLAGLTLLAARREVTQRVSSQYRGVAVELHLVRPRMLLVSLAGQTTRPGPAQVSAASRASELLSDSLMGPDASRRNIELRRRSQSKPVVIDLVRLRLTGHAPHDPLLREGDVLYVPISTRAVAIAGAVGRAGQYELAPGDSLSTLLELSGGPVIDAADDATLVRFRDAARVDSSRFKVSDVLAGRYDAPLQDGDRMFVYFRPRYHQLDQATIFGEVGRPGVYPLIRDGMRLSDLVKAAGGFLPTADVASIRVFRSSWLANEPDPEFERLAKLSRKEMTSSEYEVFRARLTARREDFRVDWNRAKSKPDLDIVLRTGDIVRVDMVTASIRVEGEVILPGLMRYEPGRRVGDYVRLAGGFSQRANRHEVRVKRAVTGHTVLARDNTALEPGDLIWVPEHEDSSNWQSIQAFLLVAAQIATVIIALRR